MLNSDITDRNALCQQYLNILYSNANEHRAHNSHKENMSTTYGELLYPSINKILTKINLTPHDVFVDFGSGIGKAAAYMFLTSIVKEVYGIELLPQLHQQALTVADKIRQDLPAFYLDNRKLTFIHGDFLKISFPTATVVLIISTCFDQDLLYQLGNVINNTPSIHTVLTLRPMRNLQRLFFKEAVHVECSWDSALCYIYNSAK